jgi:hypothetical protein
VPPGAPEKTTNRPRQGGDPFLIQGAAFVAAGWAGTGTGHWDWDGTLGLGRDTGSGTGRWDWDGTLGLGRDTGTRTGRWDWDGTPGLGRDERSAGERRRSNQVVRQFVMAGQEVHPGADLHAVVWLVRQCHPEPTFLS